VEMEVLGGEDGGRVDLANFRPVEGGLSGGGGKALGALPTLGWRWGVEGVLGIDESRWCANGEFVEWGAVPAEGVIGSEGEARPILMPM
jgi:hypothetical protein